MLKKSSLWLLILCLIASMLTVSVFADENTHALPNAEVTSLGAQIVTVDSYYIYDLVGSQKLTSASDPFALQIAMEFVAKDTPEQAEANAYGDYTTDFFIEVGGLANGSVVADGCYLAGYYATYGAWVVIPLDGFTIEEDVIYPVITSAGFDFSYVDICDSVQDFVCGIYFTDEVLAANPDLTVELSLGLSENADEAREANFVCVDSYTYDVEDFENGDQVADAFEEIADAVGSTELYDAEQPNAIAAASQAFLDRFTSYTDGDLANAKLTLNIAVKDVVANSNNLPARFVYDVTPQYGIGDTCVDVNELDKAVSFKLPVPANAIASGKANVYHGEEKLDGTYDIEGSAQDGYYVVVDAKNFSEYSVEPIAPVVVVANAQEAQDALYNAVPGTTIQLVAGVDYGTIVFGRNASQKVVDIGDIGGDAAGNERYSKYEDIVILGAEGATVDQITFEIGRVYNPDGWSYVEVENLTIKDVTFTGEKTAVKIPDGFKMAVNGLSLINCTMHDADGNDRLVYQPHSGHQDLYDKTTGEYVMTAGVKNLTITGCEVVGAYQVIEARPMKNLTITNNTFKGIKARDILLASNTGTYTGTILIADNTSEAGTERFLRASKIGDATMIVTGNTITNYLGKDPDFIKVGDATGTLTLKNNTASIIVEDNARAQAVLDKAVPGTIIQLVEGVNYGTLSFRAVPDQDNTTRVDIANAYAYDYIRSIEDITILGAAGAKVDAITFETGAKPGDWYVQVAVKNLVIDGVEFTDAPTASSTGYNASVFITTSNATVDGLTVKNCTLIGDNSKLNLVYLYGADNAKNVTLSGNTVDGVARLCELRGTENVTITNNVIKNTYEHGILLAGSNYSGTVTIANNTADRIGDRFLRMAGAGVDGLTVLVKDNTVTNYLGSSADYIKVTDAANVVTTYGVTLENNTVTVVTYVAEVNGVKYTDLQAAIDAAGAGDTVTLLTDLTLESALSNPSKGLFNIAADDKIILDLNGKTISVTDNSDGNFIVFYNYGELTVKNGTIKMIATKNRGWGAQSTVILNRGGKLTVESGSYIHLGGSDMAITIDNSANSFGDAYMYVTGGEIRSENYIAIRMRMEPAGMQGHGISNLEVSGGYIYGANRGIWGQKNNYNGLQGTLAITGGTVENSRTDRGAIDMDADANEAQNVQVTISKDAVIKGAILGGEDEYAISGGTFTVAVPEKFCAEGFVPEKNADGTYGVIEGTFVAEVNGTKYTDVKAAINAAQDGQTVKLLADAASDSYFTISKTLTLDLNGHTLTLGGANIFWIEDGGSLTVKDSSAEKDGFILAENASNLFLVMADSSFIMESGRAHAKSNVVYTGGAAATVVVKGGELKSLSGVDRVFYHTNGSITVNGGRVLGDIGFWGGTLTVNGGLFSQDVSAYCAYLKTAKKNADGLYEVVDVEKCIFIGENGYYTLEDALNAAKDGDTVEIKAAGSYVLKNKSYSEGIYWLPANLTLVGTVDGVQVVNGPAISANNLTIDNVDFVNPSNRALIFHLSGDSTIKNSRLYSANCTNYSTASGKLTIDNCEIIGTATYGLNVNEGTYDLYITNTKLAGWNSFGATGTIYFDNCEFVEGGVYKMLVFYQDAEIKNTTFVPGYEIGLGNSSQPLAEHIVITLTGCSMTDGSALIDIINSELMDSDAKVIIDGVHVNARGVAEVNGVKYATLQDALVAAQNGGTIQLLEGTIDLGGEGLLLPNTLKNVTVLGAANHASVIKNGHLLQNGSNFTLSNVTFEGILFEDACIVITPWDNTSVVENIKVNNCIFQNLDDANTYAPIHITTGSNATQVGVKNLTFTNNVVKNLTNGNKSGVYAFVSGDVVIENNVFDGVQFRSVLLQVYNDDGVADNISVVNNVIKNSPEARIQILGRGANKLVGADAVCVKINENVLTDITNYYQLCVYDMNPEKLTADASKNYYDIDIAKNPQAFYFDADGESVADLVAFGVYPIYTDLKADGTINSESLYMPVAAIGSETFATFEDALKAAQDGDIITLLADVVIANNNPYAVVIEKDITIDGNGHKISQAAGYANAWALLYVQDASVTVKNLTFDGIRGCAAIWSMRANVTVDNCVLQNCEHTQIQGLLRFTATDATIKDTKFLNNTASMLITFNFDLEDSEVSTDVLTVEGCTFEGNTCSDTALIYYVKGQGSAIENNAFVNNKVDTSSHGAIVYYSAGENCTVTGNEFRNNSIEADLARAGILALEAGTKANNNAFIGNTVKSNASGTTYVGTVLNKADANTAGVDVSENYWNGGKPDCVGVKGAPTALDSYYLAYEDGVLSNKVEIVYAAELDGVKYESFMEAFNKATAGQTIKLLADVTLSSKLEIKTAITIDGNGFKLIADENATWYTVSGKFKNYNVHLVNVKANGVTLKNITLDCNNLAAGVNVIGVQGVVFEDVSIIVKYGAALTVNNALMTLRGSFTTEIAPNNSILALDVDKVSTLTIEAGTKLDLSDKTFRWTDGSSVFGAELAVDANGNPYFAAKDNACFYTKAQMQSRAAEYSNGLTLLADVTLAKNLSVKGTLNLNGHNLTLADGYTLQISGKLTVTGEGELNASLVLTGASATLTAPAGLNVTTTVADGIVKYADGKYAVAIPVAQIGTTKYLTLQDAFNAVQDGQTIVLLSDIKLDKGISFNKDITFTIDGNGKTISPAAGSTETNSVFNFGQGNDSTVATRKYTIKNIKFVGWTTDHVVRLQGVDALVEGCTFQNCKQSSNSALGLLTLTFCDATVKDCKFIGNTCVKAIDINSWGDGSQLDTAIMDCLFQSNICSGPGVVLRSTGKSITVSGSVFYENTVSTNGNAATLYLGWGAEGSVTGCWFYGNDVITTHTTTKRFASAIFADGHIINGNAFEGNTATRAGEAISTTVAMGAYYGAGDVSENYWDGAEPSYTVEYDRNPIECNSYYKTLNVGATGMELSDKVTITYVAQIGNVKYTSLQEAINAANGKTVTVLTDVELTETLVIPYGYTVTLELNGKIISGVSATAKASEVVLNDGSLTIQDSVGGGKITSHASNPDTNGIPAYANNTITNRGTLILLSGTIENSTTAGYACFPIDNNSTIRDVALYIKGGTVTGRGAIRVFANSTTYANTVEITGGTVAGTSYGIWVQNPSNNAATDVKASLTIKDGTVARVLFDASAAFDFSISGGTVAKIEPWSLDETNADRNPNGFISGGTFLAAIAEEYCAEGYVPTENGDGTYTVIEGTYVAEVNGVKYTDLQAAINAANGKTIKLIADVTVPKIIKIEAGKKFTLDLNGKTISVAYAEGSTTDHIYLFENHGDLTITDTSAEKNGVINARGIFNYGVMTLENGTINSIDGNGGYAVRNYSGASFTMNGGKIATTLEDDHKVDKGGYDATTVRVDEGATFIMNGGEIANICDYTFAIENHGTTTIRDGKVSSVHTTVTNYGTLEIKGGSFTCNGLEGVTAHAVWAAEGTTTISGGTFDGKDNYNGFNVDASKGATVIITGGEFLPVHSGSLYGEGSIAVSGGTFFDAVPESRCAAGHIPAKNTNGTYSVKVGSYAAQIGNVKYESLLDALKNAKDGDTIIVYEGTHRVPDLTHIHFMANGDKTPANLTIVAQEGKTVVVDAIHFNVNAFPENLTVKNIIFDGTGVTPFDGGIDSATAVNGLTVENCTFKNGARITLTDAVAKNVVIKNCVFDGTGITTTPIYIPNVDGLTVTGCTISGGFYNAIQLSGTVAGDVVISNNTISGTNNRAIRLANVVGNVVISNNVFSDATDNEGELFKATSINGGSVAFTGNTYEGQAWNRATLTAGSNVSLWAYEAEVNGVKYTSLADAIKAAPNGGTVYVYAVTINGKIDPWARHEPHADDKSITILGAAEWTTGETILTGGMYLGHSDLCVLENTITVKGITFKNVGLAIGGTKTVVVENNKFYDITGPAIEVSGQSFGGHTDACVVVKNNVIVGASDHGINLNHSVNITVEGNYVENVKGNGIQIHSYYSTTGNIGANKIVVVNNTVKNWGNGTEGRAIRIGQGQDVTVNGNVLFHENAPEQFVKITGLTGDAKLDVSANYWRGVSPMVAGMFATDLAGDPARILKSYYTDAEKTNLVKIGASVAKIGDTYYASITEAILAAEDGATIELLAGTFDEYVAPWAKDPTHALEKSITIVGAENFGTVLTGGIYLGYDDSGCRAHTVTIRGIHFQTKGVLVAGIQNVVIEDNKFTDISACVASSSSANGNAISVIGKNINATIRNNVIENVTEAKGSGILLRDILNATVENNTVKNVMTNSITITTTDVTKGTIVVTNNVLDTWGVCGEGRAIRAKGGASITFTENVMIHANAPEQFAKLTDSVAIDASKNYWGGAEPLATGRLALDDGMNYFAIIQNYYTDAEKTNLVALAYAAEVDGVYYADLQTALNAAMTAGNKTVKLLCNGTYPFILGLSNGVTLDLNGCTLTANNGVVTFGIGSIVDNGATKGSLKTPYGFLALSNATYPMLPVWVDAEVGYRFVSIKNQSKEVAVDAENSFAVEFRPAFENAANNGFSHYDVFTNGAADNDITMVFVIKCVRDGEVARSIDYVVSDELIAKVYTNKTSIRFTVTGATDSYDSYVIEVRMQAKSGIVFAGDIMTYTPTASADGQ